MQREHEHHRLTDVLADPDLVLAEWLAAFDSSVMRLHWGLDSEQLQASLKPIVQALAVVVAPDRMGRRPVQFRFEPGAQELREVEKSVSFASANFAVEGFSGFDAGALFLCLRDVLCASLDGDVLLEMQHYMEWLVVLAADSLATGREQAALEMWSNQLDEGTPLIMITPELPAALFVCQPGRRVVAGVFGRLLLAVVRTGGKAVIIDVRGVSGRLTEDFADALETFISHGRVAHRIRILACGVHADDVPRWENIASKHGADLHFENYFDSCVTTALAAGGWRLIAPG